MRRVPLHDQRSAPSLDRRAGAIGRVRMLAVDKQDNLEPSGAHPQRRPDPDRVARWRETIRVLQSELRDLEWFRDEMAKVAEIVRSNPLILYAESYFPAHVLRWYVESQCLRIRRLIEGDNPGYDVWSLRLLLEDMRRAAEAFSRANIAELFDEPGIPEYSDEIRNFLVEAMWKNVGDIGRDADRLRARDIKDDLKQLSAATDAIRDIATKKLAHNSKDGAHLLLPNLNPISKAVDSIIEISKRYHATLTGESLLSYAPTYMFNWYDVFDKPWKVAEAPVAQA